MINMSLIVVPLISGSVHVMANPTFSYSTQKIVKNSKRVLTSLPIVCMWNRLIRSMLLQVFLLSAAGCSPPSTSQDSASRSLQPGRVFKLAAN